MQKTELPLLVVSLRRLICEKIISKKAFYGDAIEPKYTWNIHQNQSVRWQKKIFGWGEGA
jgi:hypothetical protein